MNKLKNEGIDFVKMDSFIIVGTFFSLWLAVFFEERVENMFAYILILTFGILHGANDLKLLQKSGSRPLNKKGFLLVLFYYLLFVGTSIALFYLIPALALTLFVLFSGYHFGEQHWMAKSRTNSLELNLFFLFYGLFILFLLFYAHIAEVTDIIDKICGYVVPQELYLYVLLLSGIATGLFGVYLYSRRLLDSSVFKELFFILVFFIVFNTASLLWAFAIYFILWHSLPSLMDQIVYLYGNVARVSIKKYIKTSFPYWLISVVGLCFLLFLFRNDVYNSLAFFFSFLAAITFPHVLVINRLNKSKN